MQNKITKPSNLLDKSGRLIQKGYATKPLLTYRRKDVARKCRLKEWDYYLVYNNKHAVALTVAKTKCIVLVSASIIDFTTKKISSRTAIRFMSCKKFSMPESSKTGDIIIKDKKLYLSICNNQCNRQLYLLMKGKTDKNDLELSLVLSQEPYDSMVIATPFKQCDKMFYYNRKIIGMQASGFARLGNESISFSNIDSYGLLDWGRGVWPYHTVWYWSVAQGRVCGFRFGFNLGYGFGDTSAATENMLFYKGIASKLEDVTFHIPKGKKGYQYMKPWKISSSDNRIELKFVPIVERKTKFWAVIFSSRQHQVFGTFSGYAVLDDGTILLINDFMGFAERVENRW